ncbi:MAG: hypothetical protein JST05_06425 [Acidobacteria bacterium]|nr:hypothetical protein [Acidobacteriota bacterium]
MFKFTRHALAAGLAAAVFVLPGCNREDAKIKEQMQQAAQADQTQQQIQSAGQQQQQALQKAGVTDVQPNPDTMQLTDEQRKALEDRIKNEKNSSYQALLQEVIDKDKQIKDMNDKLDKLKSALPKPDVVHPGESHYGLAMRFLQKQGVSKADAKRLIDNVNIMDKLAPGMEVYHFYSNGVYGTWVAKGHAKISPNELNRQERAKIEGERDTAVAQNEKLQEEVGDLATQKEQLTNDVAALSQEKATLTQQVSDLTTLSEKQKSDLNSLHYIVGNRKELEKQGVIIIPIFSKDRAGAKWNNEAFSKEVDLRDNDSLTFTAADAGVAKIGKVNVVPGSLVKDQHYSLTIAPDKMSATVKFLDKSRFTNEKVVFAVSE